MIVATSLTSFDNYLCTDLAVLGVCLRVLFLCNSFASSSSCVYRLKGESISSRSSRKRRRLCRTARRYKCLRYDLRFFLDLLDLTKVVPTMAESLGQVVSTPKGTTFQRGYGHSISDGLSIMFHLQLYRLFRFFKRVFQYPWNEDEARRRYDKIEKIQEVTKIL